MRYVVELNDIDATAFQMELRLPWISITTETDNSTWRAIDSGFIKYHRGGCKAEKVKVWGSTNILVISGGHWGIEFTGFFDPLGLVNSSGSGTILQPWVVNFKPGSFSWTLIS